MSRRHIFPEAVRATGRLLRGRPEDGDTLVEVLLALTILGVASVALLIAFGTSIKASSVHRNLTEFDTVLSSSSTSVTSQIQAQPATFFGTCAPLATYQSAVTFSAGPLPGEVLPTGFSAQITSVQYWNGTQFSSCTTGASGDDNAPQLITIEVTDANAPQHEFNSIVVDNPTLVATIQTTGTTAYKLVFAQQPAGATLNTNFTQQPVVEVEDASNNLVTSDLSPVVLTITPGSGTAGASLSTSCTGTETSGVITFSGCSINELGLGYQLTATDGSLVSATSSPFSVTAIQLATPSIATVSSGSVAGAITVSYTGSLNAPSGQSYSIKACTNSAMSAGCVTQTGFTSSGVGTVTGLTQGATYYVQLTATASTGYLAATTPPTGPTMASLQLTVPGTPSLGYGTQAGSLLVTFTGSSNAPLGQTYTAEACTNTAMSQSCVTNANFASGTNLTGLGFPPGSASTSPYYVEITANGSPGYIVSAPSGQASHLDTSQVETPTGFSAAPSASQANAVVASFTEPVGTVVPTSFTATACTNNLMTNGCVSQGNYVSGAQLTGLTPGGSYFVTVTANAPATPAGVVSAMTSPYGPVNATLQLVAPTGVSVTYGSVAGSVAVSFTAPTTVAPSQTYTAEACTTSAMTGSSCVTNANFVSGTNLTGLAYVPGSLGSMYYVTVTANGASGYLQSVATGPVPGTDTSEVQIPTGLTVAPSTSEAGAVTASFSEPSGAVAPTSFTAMACTNNLMTIGCVSQSGYTSGSQFAGLTGDTPYYVTITANSSFATTGMASATSAPSGAVNATFQLLAPTSITTSYGSVAGSIDITFTPPAIVAPSQTYTAEACTTSDMKTGCVTNSAYAAGSDLTGLAFTPGVAGTTYYVTITANNASGFLASTPSSQATQADTSQLLAPGTPSVATSTTTANAVVATFTAPSGQAPASYTAKACTTSAMNSGCVSQTNYTSGTALTGLVAGSSYWVSITAVAPSGFTNSISGVSASSAVASTQLGYPVITGTNSSANTTGDITVTFSTSAPTIANETYTVTACVDAQMKTGCVTQTPYTSGAQFGGLTPGQTYYATVTANAQTGYVSSVSNNYGPTMATVQLGAPTAITVGYGTVAGSVSVTFTPPTTVAPNQTYTATACNNTQMTTGCASNTTLTSAGGNVTGLAYTAGTAGGPFYVTVSANGSTGYLVTLPPLIPSSSQADTSAETSPTITTSQGSFGSHVVNVTITTTSSPTPSSYTCYVYSSSTLSNSSLIISGTCSTTAKGFNTGLSRGTTVYITATANSTNAAYASTTTPSYTTGTVG